LTLIFLPILYERFGLPRAEREAMHAAHRPKGEPAGGGMHLAAGEAAAAE
jgi:hypothetical protein